MILASFPASAAASSINESHYGTYLKACVNYIMITGQTFNGTPADCGLEPEKAAYLRKVAETVVFN